MGTKNTKKFVDRINRIYGFKSIEILWILLTLSDVSSLRVLCG